MMLVSTMTKTATMLLEHRNLHFYSAAVSGACMWLFTIPV
jgi:hypothetical protein